MHSTLLREWYKYYLIMAERGRCIISGRLYRYIIIHKHPEKCFIFFFLFLLEHSRAKSLQPLFRRKYPLCGGFHYH